MPDPAVHALVAQHFASRRDAAHLATYARDAYLVAGDKAVRGASEALAAW